MGPPLSTVFCYDSTIVKPEEVTELIDFLLARPWFLTSNEVLLRHAIESTPARRRPSADAIHRSRGMGVGDEHHPLPSFALQRPNP